MASRGAGKSKSLSDKERALLLAARHEVAAKTKRREVVDTAALPGNARHRGSTGPAPAAPRPAPKTSPLDAQTVLGWDHPAAQGPAAGGEDKWSRIAALMETERAQANVRRAKARRTAILFLVGLLVVVLIVVVLIVGARSLAR